MKEYQIRSDDLKEIIVQFDQDRTLDWCRHSHAKTIGGDASAGVLVLAEWETEAEADKARLDWILKHAYSDNGNGVASRASFELGEHWHHKFGDLLAAIDAARNAPQPKVTVIEEGK